MDFETFGDFVRKFENAKKCINNASNVFKMFLVKDNTFLFNDM